MTISVFTPTLPPDSSPLFPTAADNTASFRLKYRKKKKSHLFVKTVLVRWLPDLWSQLPGVWIACIVCWETSGSVFGEREKRILLIIMEFLLSYCTIENQQCSKTSAQKSSTTLCLDVSFWAYPLRSIWQGAPNPLEIVLFKELCIVSVVASLCPYIANLNNWPNRPKYRSVKPSNTLGTRRNWLELSCVVQ